VASLDLAQSRHVQATPEDEQVVVYLYSRSGCVCRGSRPPGSNKPLCSLEYAVKYEGCIIYGKVEKKPNSVIVCRAKNSNTYVEIM